ncbi:hypothetical protein AMK26_32600 [Streptomyces sp. CB03234]|uniref:ALF repeat-containing protein n=1 Tax=Streptomyces sp. (strain CB03234) TaxID=1703937 RepID=UPI0009404239|nr:ALF repeat-containing protein [Streptomyces sp. CB03234]OKJ94565.1 hypothetical protein AMK26_32600 [Streptomyces sp. CB03234]
MQTACWSRRRVLGALALATAVAATPSVLRSATAAAAGTAGTDPVPLPDTERAKVVRAWLTGGKGVRAATTALYGSDTEVRTFLAETMPQQTVQANRIAIVRSLDRAGKGLRFPPALAAADVSARAGALGTVFTGIGHGFTSGAFWESAAGSGPSLVSFGAYKWVGAAEKALGGGLVRPFVSQITDTREDLASGVTKGLSDIWGLAA